MRVTIYRVVSFLLDELQSNHCCYSVNTSGRDLLLHYTPKMAKVAARVA